MTDWLGWINYPKFYKILILSGAKMNEFGFRLQEFRWIHVEKLINPIF
jgi:hypothetical protein